MLEFNKLVYSFMFSICLWSNNENLDGTAYLKVKDAGGHQTTLIRLKNDLTLGDRNKGRLSIDDMAFSTESKISKNQYYILNYEKTSV